MTVPDGVTPPAVSLGSLLVFGKLCLMMSMASLSALKHTLVRNRVCVCVYVRVCVRVWLHSLGRRCSCVCVCVLRFGLHGVGTLSDETLPPGGRQQETTSTNTSAFLVIIDYCVLMSRVYCPLLSLSHQYSAPVYLSTVSL